ncbi:RNA exonuclease 1 homolog isoform 2-T2 [Leptodactylus fuscus]|uniref:RNA exonuclease 1 homolog isoform X2 n=1 Tax=Leptodactylus fuscus TaxID=238119 RepID=UPI003F4E4BBC
MLKNTGYFRGIECPFSENCFRPHCLFRHRERSVGSGKARNGAEYDPYNPELPAGPPRMDDDPSGVFPEPSLHVLELERVNKAIEEIKSQVEREQRKYEELLETNNAPLKQCLRSDSLSSFEYDPGCSGNNASCYSPTPLAQSLKPCKYTLDNVEPDRSNSRTLEYIPTTVSKVSRYRANKYVIDNSKPYTDLEYDPMLNYSARLLSKVNSKKVSKRSRTNGKVESHAPVSKKLRKPNLPVEAKFSDSEGDSQPECPPKTGKSLHSDRSSSITSATKSSGPETKKSFKAVKETSVQYDSGNSLKNYSRENIKKTNKPLDLKNGKNERIREQPSTMDLSQMTCTSKDQKNKSLKSHSKKKIEQVEVKNVDNKHEHRQKKERTSEQKTILIENKTDTESKHCKEKPSKTDSRTKDQGVKNVKCKAKNQKSGSLDKSKMAVPETCNVKRNMRTLSHVDLFGDETSDEDENRKASLQDNLTCSKGEKSIHRSKVTSQRNSDSFMDSPEMDLDSDSDIDPMEECLRVFNESHDIKTEDKGRMGKQSENNEDKSEQSSVAFIPGQKRRISHVTCSNNMDSPSKVAIRSCIRPTPQEICYQRIQKAQEQAAQLLAQEKTALLSNIAQKSNSLKKTGGKNAELVDTVETCNGSSSAIKLRTLSGMASKTKSTTVKQRQAHVPSLQSATLKRPVLPTEFGAKVPTTVRQRYLNLFIDECLKSCQSQEEAFNKALEEEKIVYNRSSSRNIYLNVAVNTLKKLRSQGSQKKAVSPEVVNKKAVSHESMLGGKLAAKTSFSVQRTIHQDEELTEAAIYKKLKKYILTPEELKEHGYPLVHPEKSGRAMVFTAEENKNSDSSCKICCRCGAEYLVTPSGKCVRQEECVHHWGRLRRQRVPGGWETLYSCCSGAVGSAGCQVSKCYTTKGLELTRVTVVNSKLKVVYDTFVQPDNKIVDYNTRFSGVTEEDLQNTSITLRDVQAVLLCMFSCDSVLIGHSLESDLFALKLIHPTVVDTAIVFPHRLGLPYKRALRSLMADYLKRIIQDNVEGHDSSEDACSCMELMIWRIKEDAKVKR